MQRGWNGPGAPPAFGSGATNTPSNALQTPSNALQTSSNDPTLQKSDRGNSPNNGPTNSHWNPSEFVDHTYGALADDHGVIDHTAHNAAGTAEGTNDFDFQVDQQDPINQVLGNAGDLTFQNNFHSDFNGEDHQENINWMFHASNYFNPTEFENENQYNTATAGGQQSRQLKAITPPDTGNELQMNPTAEHSKKPAERGSSGDKDLRSSPYDSLFDDADDPDASKTVDEIEQNVNSDTVAGNSGHNQAELQSATLSFPDFNDIDFNSITNEDLYGVSNQGTPANINQTVSTGHNPASNNFPNQSQSQPRLQVEPPDSSNQAQTGIAQATTQSPNQDAQIAPVHAQPRHVQQPGQRTQPSFPGSQGVVQNNPSFHGSSGQIHPPHAQRSRGDASHRSASHKEVSQREALLRARQASSHPQSGNSYGPLSLTNTYGEPQQPFSRPLQHEISTPTQRPSLTGQSRQQQPRSVPPTSQPASHERRQGLGVSRQTGPGLGLTLPERGFQPTPSHHSGQQGRQPGPSGNQVPRATPNPNSAFGAAPGYQPPPSHNHWQYGYQTGNVGGRVGRAPYNANAGGAVAPGSYPHGQDPTLSSHSHTRQVTSAPTNLDSSASRANRAPPANHENQDVGAHRGQRIPTSMNSQLAERHIPGGPQNSTRHDIDQGFHLFSSLEEARRAKSIQRAEPTFADHTYPRTPENHQKYVRMFFKAMTDCSDTGDWTSNDRAMGRNPSLAYKAIVQRKYDPAYVQIVCWELLERLKQRYVSGPLVPDWQKPRKDKRHERFASAVVELCLTLKSQKTICKRLLDAPFVDELVDNPVGQLKRAQQNKRLNASKAIHIIEGRKAMGVEKGRGRKKRRAVSEELDASDSEQEGFMMAESGVLGYPGCVADDRAKANSALSSTDAPHDELYVASPTRGQKRNAPDSAGKEGAELSSRVNEEERARHPKRQQRLPPSFRILNPSGTDPMPTLNSPANPNVTFYRPDWNPHREQPTPETPPPGRNTNFDGAPQHQSPRQENHYGTRGAHLMNDLHSAHREDQNPYERR